MFHLTFCYINLQNSRPMVQPPTSFSRLHHHDFSATGSWVFVTMLPVQLLPWNGAMCDLAPKWVICSQGGPKNQLYNWGEITPVSRVVTYRGEITLIYSKNITSTHRGPPLHPFDLNKTQMLFDDFLPSLTCNHKSERNLDSLHILSEVLGITSRCQDPCSPLILGKCSGFGPAALPRIVVSWTNGNAAFQWFWDVRANGNEPMGHPTRWMFLLGHSVPL